MAKELLGRAAAARVMSGTRLGLGSGTTVSEVVRALGERQAEGTLAVTVVAASTATERELRHAGITVEEPGGRALDIAIDGADAVGPQGVLIKGGGAALVRERLVFLQALHRLVLVDATKPIGSFGPVCVPVAVVPFGWRLAQQALDKTGVAATLRTSVGVPIVTDDGLYILDATLENLRYPERLHDEWRRLPGVVDTGIFAEFQPEVWISDGISVWPLSNTKP